MPSRLLCEARASRRRSSVAGCSVTAVMWCAGECFRKGSCFGHFMACGRCACRVLSEGSFHTVFSARHISFCMSSLWCALHGVEAVAAMQPNSASAHVLAHAVHMSGAACRSFVAHQPSSHNTQALLLTVQMPDCWPCILAWHAMQRPVWPPLVRVLRVLKCTSLHLLHTQPT